MIKNKIKVLVVTAACLIGLNTSDVQAVSGLSIQGRFTGQADTGIDYNTNDIKSNYKDSRFEVRVRYTKADGTVYDKTEEAYCIDVGYHMSGSFQQMQCQRIENGALLYVLQNLTDNHTINELVLRMVAIATGEAKTLNGYGQAVQAFAADGTSLRSTNDIGAEELRQARELYQKAMQHVNDSSNGSGSISNNRSGKLIFEEKSASSSADGESYTAIYNVYTYDGSSIETVKFTCDGCTIENSTWNGQAGTVRVHVDKPKCSFTINADYKDNGNGGTPGTPGTEGTPGIPGSNGQNGNDQLYLCWYGTSQQLLISIDEDTADDIGDQPGKPGTDGTDGTGGNGGSHTQSYTGTVSSSVSGEYYNKYCSNQCNPDEDGTKINIPEYCDDASGKTMTITGPTNIKACVLNGKDEAGNTYQDTSIVSNNNPYCAVYCKEDYEMTLPGAKYTNSGSNFSLERTKVTGTRTCYITANDPYKEGIDVEKYISDIENAQRELVNAYNEYSKQKAIYDNINNAVLDNDQIDCDGNNKYDRYTLGSQKYKTYNIISCETGVCTVKEEDGKLTEPVIWGDIITVNRNIVNPSDTSLDGYNCSMYGTDNENSGKYYCESCSTQKNHIEAPTAPNDSAITAAKNKLDNIINNMKNCYNWNVDFCFEPTVEFDYNEQYSTDINYSRVGNVADEGSSEESGASIDANYNVSGGSANSNNQYLNCTTSGCTNKAITADGISPTIRFIKKSQTKSAEYANTQAFQTNYPHGTISKAELENNTNLLKNYNYLGAVFPVALRTEAGVYNWTLKFSNIGQYNNDASTCENKRMGRLNQVAQVKFNTDLENTLGYVCVYVVDCDDCDYGCTCSENLPDGFTCFQKDKFTCEITSVDCPTCEPYCIDCVFNGNDTYTYRTISLNNINPNERIMGSNWTTDKGVQTLEDIEQDGENAYTTPQYSYTISPTQMKNIRDYNALTQTYSAEDLTYHDMDGYRNIYGTSSFLDLENTQKGKYFTENIRNTTWELFAGNVNTEGSGPAWK